MSRGKDETHEGDAEQARLLLVEGIVGVLQELAEFVSDSFVFVIE